MPVCDRPTRSGRPRLAALALLTSAVASLPLAAQDSADTLPVFRLDGLNITATRGLRPVFSTPVPVTVLDAGAVHRSGALNASELFLRTPGLDAEGVGPTQRRPVIRGMRGQRVLLLEDGLRLNNVRRRADSGEPTGLVWLSDVERMEVVRGPASVLYGSDAIGGVVNLVTRGAYPTADTRSGFVEGGHRSAGSVSSLSGAYRSRVGPIAYAISGGLREADPYAAPAGTFGTLSLDDEAEVHDSGGKERSLRVEARWAGPTSEVYLRQEGYRSDDSGFGWIDPALLGGTVTSRLWWPEQDFQRTVFGYRGRALGYAGLDDFDVAVHYQRNERSFLTEVHSPFPGPPGAVLDVLSENYTDMISAGFRIEARKLARPGVLVTYGLDLYRDRSSGNDTSTTTITGLGPAPTVTGRGGPTIPDARLRNLGLFAQTQIELGGATEVILGTRYQDVVSRTVATPGNTSEPVNYEDRTLVGALNVLHSLTEEINLVASVGRGFRTPNLVERFFTGLTGNGRGFWEANPELGPETSLNLEAGLRLRSSRVHAEAFVFRNALTDGIVLEPTGDSVGRAVVYRNVNVEELNFQGLELSAGFLLGAGFSGEGNVTLLDVDDPRDPDRVVTETYPMKTAARLRWDSPDGGLWLDAGLRHNGERETVEGTTPVGDAIPAFTVFDLRGGVSLAGGYRLTVGVENLTNELYAESLNTGFFRPEPGRSFHVSLAVAF